MINPYKEIISVIKIIPNDRTRDVVGERFGIWDGNPKTLQSIGDKYGITRERVRQIQEAGFKTIKDNKVINRLDPIIAYLKDYLDGYGNLRRESAIFPDAKNHRDFNFSEKEKQFVEPILQFCLAIAEPFSRHSENDDFHPMWVLNKSAITSAKKFIDNLVVHLKKKNQVMSLDEILKAINVSGLSDKAKLSYVDATKHVNQNNFSRWGLSLWPEIRLRGVRDKAFVILQNNGKPMHFSEVAKAISDDFQTVNTQTVHNELIKDDRFVLVGRGSYGLKGWGFEGGTVKDLIEKIIKEKGPQDKDSLLKQVLKQKLVKPNTVLVNLQNKSSFKKDTDGRYSIVA